MLLDINNERRRRLCLYIYLRNAKNAKKNKCALALKIDFDFRPRGKIIDTTPDTKLILKLL